MTEIDPLQRNGAVGAINAHISTVRDDLLRELGRMEQSQAALWEEHLRDYRALKLEVERHHHEAETDKITTAARVAPIRAGAGWLWDHWRDLLLLAIGAAAAATFLLDAVGHWAAGVP